MSIRARYLMLRKQLIPWCMRSGCWNRSSVMPKRVVQGRRVGGRGNVCPGHLIEALMTNLEDPDA